MPIPEFLDDLRQKGLKLKCQHLEFISFPQQVSQYDKYLYY